MNLKQKEAYDIAIAVHNLYIGGSAGTGKSFLISEIENGLRKADKSVHITCTTGIACANFSNAMTIHRWAGIDDGRYSSKEIATLIKETPKHRDTLERLMKADTLIIDEISMLSDKLFQQLEEVCSLKNPDVIFGGIQLILCGDFRQLPPVPNVQYNDEGNFCFQSELFQTAVPHRVILCDIIRQQDQTLIKAIQEVSEGVELTEESLTLINSMERPLPTGPPSVKLFATNNLVDDYNRRRILNWRGELIEYSAVDTGDKKHLSKILAPQKLWLKEGCPVVLLRNFSKVLYNGLQGYIVSLGKDGPVVDFGSLGVHRITKIKFTVFSPVIGKNVAERMQYPLKLAFALSIHKAQGMTLDRVEVDCRNIFKAGQLGVAMGRVRSAAGLRILNFNPSVCIQQPDIVQTFIDTPSRELDDSLHCCNAIRQVSMDWQTIFGPDDDDDFIVDGNLGCEGEAETEEEDEDTFDDDFNKIIVSDSVFSTDELSEYTLPASFDPGALLQTMRSKHEATAIQTESNELIDHLLKFHVERVADFCKKQFLVLSAFMEDLNVTASGSVKSEALCHFYEKCNRHQTSQEYLLTAMILFQDLPIHSDAQAHICYKLAVEVRKFLLQEKVDLFQTTKKSTYQRFVTSASKARIRYVGGYCISKVRYRNLQLQKTRATKVSIEDQQQYEESTMAINILDALRENEVVLEKHSALPETLVDVIRKQNVSRGLTQIRDELFLFFMKLCEHCLTNLTDQHLHQHGQHLHSQCFNVIMGNIQLYEQFLKVVKTVPMKSFSLYENTCDVGSSVVEDILNKLTLEVSVTECIYKDIVEKFVMVMLNQFRKDLLQAFSVEKTLAHRKQILIKKSKQSDIQGTVSFDSISKDNSIGKDMSHNLLKGLLLQQKDVLKSFTKTNLQTLCKAYSLKVSRVYTKAKLMQDLKARILASNAMPNPNVIHHDTESKMAETTTLSEPQPGPSSAADSFEDTQKEPKGTSTEEDEAMLQKDPEEEEVCKCHTSSVCVMEEQCHTSSVCNGGTVPRFFSVCNGGTVPHFFSVCNEGTVPHL
ncbi:uncharacterized protein LOC117315301 [Pecten maximus]|uniref:uncharacterized protein LOC117315301 n=1 Tax=Pecten maximus TaxID=6579 RepID=UPI00145878F0|nr:uncharacterized protein LOC117315301 [Pecten maximus]